MRIPLTRGEERRLRNFLSSKEKMDDIIEKSLDEETFDFLQSQGRLDYLHDRLIIPARQIPYQSITFLKFITPDLDVPELLRSIIFFMR